MCRCGGSTVRGAERLSEVCHCVSFLLLNPRTGVRNIDSPVRFNTYLGG